ncbi:MAG TPA: aminotransferase class I/II-fold pyridoxal phosphate-dependent enzyme, partial [Opitutales bacterium]|nr:aminotransferase class I/II-fold pyridoxal phosphate-dependent enzyme [Opitutales bacterium]
FIAPHLRDIPKSGIREFFSIVEQNPQAISLGVGEPDFVTPWAIREAAIFALERGKTTYTNNFGLLRLRKAFAAYLETHFDLSYHPDDEILVTVGVSEAMDLACRALLNPGDKVMYHEPCFVSYMPSIAMTHAVPITVPTSAKDDFALDPDVLERCWEPGVKALIINFPTNPTGGVADRARLERIARFAIEKDIIVISDEVYAELTFGGEKHVSIATLPGMRDRTIFLHGMSKAWAMTGFRLGYACGPRDIIDAMMKVHQYAMMCAPILSQEAAVEALKNGDADVAKMRDSYERRRDFIIRRFNEIGLPCHMPKATFYSFPNVSGFGMSERDFCIGLLNAEDVAIVPGTAFGEDGKGFARASFSTSYERITKAMERIERYVGKLGRV